MRNPSATCALSRRERNANITSVTAASTASQSAHVIAMRRPSGGGGARSAPYEVGLTRDAGGFMSALRLEPIPDAWLGYDVARCVRIGLDLPPQVRHVHAEVLLRIAVRSTPHRAKELLMRDRSADVSHECHQEPPFGGRQVHCRAVARHGAARHVDHEVAELQ